MWSPVLYSSSKQLAAGEAGFSCLPLDSRRMKLVIPTEPQGYTAVQGQDIDEEGVR